MLPVVVVSALVVLVITYWFPVRRAILRWGASPADLARAMPGDAIVSSPTYLTTLAITVEARPEQIWPWLVQIGHRRGGLYSYDWLDRLFGYIDAPSADRILPAFQQLRAGEMIPMGRGAGFPVASVAPNESLVMGDSHGGFGWSWTFGLYPIDGTRTRLVTRNRAHVPPGIAWAMFMRLLEPAAFIMTRRMLIGLKTRAESLSQTEVMTQKTAA
jgi:hypothetical protein